MTDEKYVFIETEKERKRNGRGAFNKKNGSKSKKCTLPYEYLTNKQKKELNGEVMNYKMKNLTWAEFMSYPHDIQNSILDNFACKKARLSDVADHLGVKHANLKTYIYRHKLHHDFIHGCSKIHPDWEHYISIQKEISMNVANAVVEEKPKIEGNIKAVVDVFEGKGEIDIPETPIEEIDEKVPDHGTFKWENNIVHPSYGSMRFSGFPLDVFDSIMKLMDPLKKYKIIINFEELE